MTKRPAPVTFLTIAVLLLTAWNLFRLTSALANWNLLKEFAPRPGPLYISVSASFWTLSGIALWTALRRWSIRSQVLSAIYFAGFALWWWADRLLLQPPRPNGPFALLVTVIFLTFIAVNIFRRKTL